MTQYLGYAIDHLAETARMTDQGVRAPHAYQSLFSHRIVKGGQDPHIGDVACFDSYADRESTTTRHSRGPNRVGTGDTAGSLLVEKTADLRNMDAVWSATVPVGYFTNHIWAHGDIGLYILNAEGHADCGFINAFLAGNYDKLPENETALYNALASVEELMDPTFVRYTRKEFSAADRKRQLQVNAQVGIYHLDSQVAKLMEIFPKAATSENWLPIVTWRDFGNILYDGAKGANRIHVTNIAGITDRNDILNHRLMRQLTQKGVSDRELEILVQRPKFL